MLAYNHQLWQVVSLRPEYNGLYVNSFENLMALINVRFGPTLRYIEMPCELVTSPILHELSNKCPSLKYMTLDFSNAMQLHDFNDLNSFPCNLRSLCICLSEVIFLEGFMRRIYSCLSSLQVLHLIGNFQDFTKCFWYGLSWSLLSMKPRSITWPVGVSSTVFSLGFPCGICQMTLIVKINNVQTFDWCAALNLSEQVICING